MPRVPTYDSFQVAPTVQPGAQFDAPRLVDTASKAAAEMGTGMMNLGVAGLRIEQEAVQQANQVRVNDALNTLVKSSTDLRVKAAMIKGRNALERPDGKSLPDEFSEQLDEQARSISEGLGNDDQRRIFSLRASDVSRQMYGALSNHVVEQQKVYQRETWNSTIKNNQERAILLWGDSAARQESLNAIDATLAEVAKSEGFDRDPKVIEERRRELQSPVHAGIVSSMIKAGRAGDARKYYESNSAMMTSQARANVQGAVQDASDNQAAEIAVENIWSELGPKGLNEPVLIFEMEKQLRAQFKDSPEIMKRGNDFLRSRMQSFNAQQNEVNAGNVNAVFGLLDSGTPMGMVMRSDAWLELPETKRREISRALDAEAISRAQRAEAAERRADRNLLLRNADSYLTYSDPTMLSGMSRAQVQALRPTFGVDATMSLLNRWDSLQKSEGKMEATFDQDTFNQVADEMGLGPFKSRKSSEDREMLGALKYRVEKLIEIAQTQKKAPLTRAEKEELVRGEMARTVTVDTWYSPERTVPVIALRPDDVRRVQVPAGDRQQILDALQRKFKEQPDNPLFAPTEDNVRRLYLLNKSRAGAFVDGQ